MALVEGCYFGSNRLSGCSFGYIGDLFWVDMSLFSILSDYVLIESDQFRRSDMISFIREFTLISMI